MNTINLLMYMNCPEFLEFNQRVAQRHEIPTSLVITQIVDDMTTHHPDSSATDIPIASRLYFIHVIRFVQAWSSLCRKVCIELQSMHFVGQTLAFVHDVIVA